MLAKILFSSFLFLLISGNAFACGIYELNGIVRLTKEHFQFVIAEKTQSQMILVIPSTEEMKMAPYIDFPVTATVTIDKAMDGTLGSVKSVEKVIRRAPDPLHPTLDSYLHVKKQRKCLN